MGYCDFCGTGVFDEECEDWTSTRISNRVNSKFLRTAWIIIPVVDFRSPDDELLKQTKNLLHSSLISLYMSKQAIRVYLNYIKENYSNYVNFEECKKFLLFCYHNYGKSICYDCFKQIFGEKKDYFNFDRFSIHTFKLGNRIDVVLKLGLASTIARYREQYQELQLLDSANIEKIGHHRDLHADFSIGQLNSLRKRKEFKNSVQSIKKMVIAAIKSSLEDFKKYIFLNILGIPYKEKRWLRSFDKEDENVIEEVIVNPNSLEVLWIFPNPSKVNASENKLKSLFDKYVISRNFWNYLDPNENWYVKTKNYEPQITDYSLDIDDDNESLSIRIFIEFKLG